MRLVRGRMLLAAIVVAGCVAGLAPARRAVASEPTVALLA